MATSSTTTIAATGLAAHTGHLPVGLAVAVSVVIAVLALLTTILVHVTPQESQHRAACIKAVLSTVG